LSLTNVPRIQKENFSLLDVCASNPFEFIGANDRRDYIEEVCTTEYISEDSLYSHGRQR
jgi:hypothetical protein